MAVPAPALPRRVIITAVQGLPLRAAARGIPERGRIGVRTVAETRAVHEY